VQARLDKGEKPHFLPETRRIRESDWKVWVCDFILCCLPIGRSYDEDGEPGYSSIDLHMASYALRNCDQILC